MWVVYAGIGVFFIFCGFLVIVLLMLSSRISARERERPVAFYEVEEAQRIPINTRPVQR